MSLAPGVYDEPCTKLLEELHAEGVLLIVVGGTKGSGFSATFCVTRENAGKFVILPGILRKVAMDVEDDLNQIIFKKEKANGEG